MRYIILAAGQGNRLHPATLNYPKVLYRINRETTLLSRLIEQINTYDEQAQVTIVAGFMRQEIADVAPGCEIVYNPFYAVTNSIASLWLVREKLCEDVVVLGADLIFEDSFVRDAICSPIKRPTVYMDTSRASTGDYCIQAVGDRVITMAKNLSEPTGEYMSFAKLSASSAACLKDEIETMVEAGHYDQWYENALVNMIFQQGFSLYCEDARGTSWSEIDTYDDISSVQRVVLGDGGDDLA